jgi:hypothetical protein
VTVLLQSQELRAAREKPERGVQANVGEVLAEVPDEHVVGLSVVEGNVSQILEQGLVHEREATLVTDQSRCGSGRREYLRLLDPEAQRAKMLAHLPAGLPGRVGDVAEREAGGPKALDGLAGALDGLVSDVDRPVQVQQ